MTEITVSIPEELENMLKQLRKEELNLIIVEALKRKISERLMANYFSEPQTVEPKNPC